MSKRNAATELNHRQPYATPDEVQWLQKAASKLPKNGQTVILGAGPGIMAMALKDGNPSLNIYLVDHDTCYWALTHLTSEGKEYADKVAGVIADSSTAGKNYIGPQLDLLIVDADHTDEGVSRDILAWVGHVKEGGLIFFHDYDARGTMFETQEQYPGVKLAVDRYMGDDLVETRVGTSIVYRKRSI